MLTLTDNAATVIRNVTAGPDLPPDAGLRISPQPERSDMLSLAVTPGPAEGDQLVESGGARVYLEPAAATVLDNATLDAEVGPEGDVAFSIVEAGL